MEGRVSKQYRSQTMASIHETAEGLHDSGVMDRHDEACLTSGAPADRQGDPCALREG
jgi:hypothetical protein